MARSPASVANICFFELDWYSGLWDEDETGDDEIVGDAEGGCNSKEMVVTSSTSGHEKDFPSIERKDSLEDFAERFRNTQQALLGMPDLQTTEPIPTTNNDAVVSRSRRNRSDSMRNAMILTMLASGDSALAKAAAEAARTGYPLIVSPYQVLQVRRDATTFEIQQAYRRLALWHHPGRCCGGSISAEERSRRKHVFDILAASYETLVDRETRTRCDVLLREKYEERTRSNSILQGKVCVGGKPLTTENGTKGSEDQKDNAMDNFAVRLIGQLAFLRGFGNLGEESDVIEEEKAVKSSVAPMVATIPSIEPVSSSDSSLAENHDDDCSDCSSDCSFTHSPKSSGRIHMPLGTPIGALKTTTTRQTESVASSPLSLSLDFGSATRSATSSPTLQKGLTDSQTQSQSQPPKAATKEASDTVPMPNFLSMTACGMSSLGSFDSHAPPPPLMNSTSTSGGADVKGDIHYTEGETNRLFGGPLQLLYRARRWKPFRDPYQVFAEVFGSHVSLGSKPIVDTPGPCLSLRSAQDILVESSGGGGSTAGPTLMTPPPTCSAAWTGTSETLADGTQIFRTSRVLHNRKMTRTEAVRTDPVTGLKYSKVTVTSEPLEGDETEGGGSGSNQDARMTSQDGCLSGDKTMTNWNEFGACCSLDSCGAGLDGCCSRSLSFNTDWCQTMSVCGNFDMDDFLLLCGSETTEERNIVATQA